MKAFWNDTLIAESNDTVVVEGNHYFLEDSLNKNLITKSSTTSICPWKGTAHYYTLTVNGKENVDAVWYYPDPKEAARQVKGRVAFWKGVSIIE